MSQWQSTRPLRVASHGLSEKHHPLRPVVVNPSRKGASAVFEGRMSGYVPGAITQKSISF